MQSKPWMPWAAAVLSAALLELPFPLAGPLPPEHAVVAYSALAPLIWAILRTTESPRRPLRTAFLISYLCGVLWYAGNCYWIYDTMLIHGGLSPLISALLLVGFSLVLGLYFAFFGLGVAFVCKRLGVLWALCAAPLFWTSLELAAARITSVPWDQLGYSQVDSASLTMLAPFTGVYGISYVLVVVNTLLAGAFVLRVPSRKAAAAMAAIAIAIPGTAGLYFDPPKEPTTATAVLIQPNLDVSADQSWVGPDWDSHIAQFRQLASEQCKTYIAGIPQTNAPNGEIVCPPYPTHPDLVVWPEAPAPFAQPEPRFQQAIASVAQSVKAPVIVGGIGADWAGGSEGWREYNSAMLISPAGTFIGRYDKIHLVPFGEYIPFQDLLTFAHKLTGRVGTFDRGSDRTVFRIPDQHGTVHRYGIFICYEAVFASEVRQFVRNGAEVLVNISDDAWYRDTSAPWQHLNMARMRAIENRRWLLRDTNNGVTAVIDSYGRVRQSIPRHQTDSLPAQFAFRDDATFYTLFGDVFAWLCAIFAFWFLLRAFNAKTGASARHLERRVNM